MARPRVLLGDDHVMFCEGLRSILEPHFEVVGIAENGQELVAAAERLQPDVVVADVSMPLLNGIGAARKLQKTKRPPKIVFLTMHADPTFATEAFRAGASGYVLKSSPGSRDRNGDSGSDSGSDAYFCGCRWRCLGRLDGEPHRSEETSSGTDIASERNPPTDCRREIP